MSAACTVDDLVEANLQLAAERNALQHDRALLAAFAFELRDLCLRHHIACPNPPQLSAARCPGSKPPLERLSGQLTKQQRRSRRPGMAPLCERLERYLKQHPASTMRDLMSALGTDRNTLSATLSRYFKGRIIRCQTNDHISSTTYSIKES